MIPPIITVMEQLSSSGFTASLERGKSSQHVKATKQDGQYNFIIDIDFSKKIRAVLTVKNGCQMKYLIDDEAIVEKMLITLQLENYKDYVCHGSVAKRERN